MIPFIQFTHSSITKAWKESSKTLVLNDLDNKPKHIHNLFKIQGPCNGFKMKGGQSVNSGFRYNT